MDFEKLCAERYSLRKFSDRQKSWRRFWRQATMHRRLITFSRSEFS